MAAGAALSACAESQLLEQLHAGSPQPQTEAAVKVRPAAADSFYRQQMIGDKLAARALQVMQRSKDDQLEAYLGKIVDRLQRAQRANGVDLQYRVYLIDSPHANAFTPGGGHLFVTTGIVTRLRTEAQMAMVLAHEMAHNAASHVVKGQEGQSIKKRVAAFGKRVFDDGLGIPWLSSGVNKLADTSFNSYTRAQEEEADLIGLRYLVAAGYDPRQAPQSFAALIPVKAQKKSIFQVFDGYPEGIKRAEDMNAIVHARYRNADTSGYTVNTRDYVEVASPYWQ